MGNNEDKPGVKSDGRYEKLLKGEITSDQYVKSLRQEAHSRYSAAKSGRYITKRSGRRSSTRRAAS